MKWALIKAIVLCAVLAPTSAAADNSSLIRLKQRDALLGWEAVGRVAIGTARVC